MCTTDRFPTLAFALLLCLAGCAPHEGSPGVLARNPGLEEGRRTAYFATGDAFAVGSELDLPTRSAGECLDRTFIGSCISYAPDHVLSWVSTDTTVLDRLPGNRWTLVGPGEATLVLSVDEVAETRIVVRAERAHTLEAILVAQPANRWTDANVAAVLRPADGAAILRTGAGARFFVRARDEAGELLAGMIPLTITPGPGLELSDEPAYWGDTEPRTASIVSIAASADAPDETWVELATADASTIVALRTVDPAELTEIRTVELTIDEPLLHAVEVTVWAGTQEVAGGSLGFVTSESSDCEYADVFGFELDREPRDTRFFVESYCGDDAEPGYRVFLAERPDLALDLVVGRRAR